MSHSTKFFTASAWIVVDSLFIFMIGPNRQGDKLGVVRIGGHLERQETPWMCAAREAKEEADLSLYYLPPPATYKVVDTGAEDIYRLENIEIGSGRWDKVPILMGSSSVYFLAGSNDLPKPMSESCGLLLLSCEDVLFLSTETVTLGEFLTCGGQAVFRDDLPPLRTDMELEPRGPKLLAKVLELHPGLAQEAGSGKFRHTTPGT